MSHTPDIQVVVIFFNVFGYDVILGWDSNLPPAQKHLLPFILPQSVKKVSGLNLDKNCILEKLK